MLSNIITKVATKRIARILLEKKASLSEIARESNTTKANIFHSLQELEKNNIVRKEIKGKTHLYHFNYLHSQAQRVLMFFLQQRQQTYAQKMNGLPILVHHLLVQMLGKKYSGVIFFGSSIDGNYRDIDVFVVAKGIKEHILREKLKKLNPKLSITLGVDQELRQGVQEEDMLYRNIARGVPFGCEDLLLETRHRQQFARRKDIVERFIIGYREILSCLEFTEKEYVVKHLDKGLMDITYAALAYAEIFPTNDRQARKLFKGRFGFVFSRNVAKAKKQAEKMGKMIL